MSRERRPTEHVQSLVKANRLRVIIPIQAVFLVAACALVWGWLAADHREMAFGIIGALIFAEVVLVILFLRQPVEGDETDVQPLSDSPESTILADPSGGTIVIDKIRRSVTARNGEVEVDLPSARSVLADTDDHCRLMIATDADLVVLFEIPGALEKERAKTLATARLLARIAELPFDDA